MTSELEKLIGEVEADIAQHGLSPGFNTADEFMASLKRCNHATCSKLEQVRL